MQSQPLKVKTKYFAWHHGHIPTLALKANVGYVAPVVKNIVFKNNILTVVMIANMVLSKKAVLHLMHINLLV